MKILAFVDMHGSIKAFNEIKKKAKGANILVCAGDISMFENNIKSIIRKFGQLKKPVLMIHGNHESPGTMKSVCSAHNNILFIHKALYTLGDVQFIGYGGGGFTVTDDGFEKFMKKAMKDIDKKKKVILITHAPPYGTNLDIINSNHYGNKSVRNFIKLNKIDIAISGHLHECACHTDKINKVMLINPGPKGKLIEVD
ncbi:metallophosphoesterase [Candidatus Woesearchaeota archaeon]|nr:metallophosphoesterase [Candidatus Woesearchaeota archaeon]